MRKRSRTSGTPTTAHTAGETSLRIQGQIVERERSWYVARVVQTVPGAGGRPASQRVAFTNPIYFDDRVKVAPAPLRAQVTGRVVGPDGPLPAQVGVWDGSRVAASVRADPDGRYSITCSPYAMLVAIHDGHLTATRRVYPHTRADELVRSIHCRVDGAGPETLWNAKTYGRADLLAGRASVNFALRRR